MKKTLLTIFHRLDNVSSYPKLIDLLLSRGVSPKDCAKIAGRNVLRVWHEVDKVSARLRKTIDPLEDDVSMKIGSIRTVYEDDDVNIKYEL